MSANDVWSYAVDDIIVAFSGRRGGISTGPFAEANISLSVGDDPDAVRANRRLLLQSIGIPRATLVTVRQQHTGVVIAVTRDMLPRPPAAADLAVTADGMVTRDSGICLLVGVADCAPVALFDPIETVVGLVHIGWRGLVSGMVPAAAAAMQRLGASMSDMRAIVGPTIAACCYPVGPNVYDVVVRHYPKAAATSRDQRPALDLREGIREAFRRVGIEDVAAVGGCTADNAMTSFSRRRDGPTGCQAGLVAVAAC